MFNDTATTEIYTLSLHDALPISVFNRTTSKADSWIKEYQGLAKSTIGEATQNSEIVFTCVGKDDDLREVMEGDNGILNNVKENTIIVDHTTASANIAREYFDICKKRKSFFGLNYQLKIFNFSMQDYYFCGIREYDAKSSFLAGCVVQLVRRVKRKVVYKSSP